MKKIFIRCFGNMLGFYASSLLFPAINATSMESFFWAGLVLGLLNLFVRPLLLFISLPLTLITLGLFTLVINTLLVIMTQHLISGLIIPTFSLSFITAFLISIINIVMTHMFSD